ncbi:hypothetical protein [Coraliomargarita parva]|uniref:hypothetical protein n=1 Tax=Coraliomargarita parva TaxID=3014050 RepID=UPI0022B4F2E7|nr:hypothetical protein [Coraliomargarita parva]
MSESNGRWGGGLSISSGKDPSVFRCAESTSPAGSRLRMKLRRAREEELAVNQS